MARNCSGKSDVGGGLKIGCLLGSSLSLEAVLSGFEGLFVGLGAKGVRVSPWGIRGKEEVEKM